MRYLFLLSFSLLFLNHSFAQKTKASKDTTKKVIYSEIVKVDSSNRFELYQKASKWIEHQTFEVEEEDPMTGKITAKNRFEVYTDKGVLSKPNGDFTHDVIIDVKDGKYR